MSTKYRPQLLFKLEDPNAPIQVVLAEEDIAQYRRFLINAPQIVLKPMRPSFYEGPHTQRLRYVWELELQLKHTDWRLLCLEGFFWACVRAFENGQEPQLKLLDYIDPICDPTSAYPTAPNLPDAPTWQPPPDLSLPLAPKFAEFRVLLEQPVRTRKGIPTSIELRVVEYKNNHDQPGTP